MTEFEVLIEQHKILLEKYQQILKEKEQIKEHILNYIECYEGTPDECIIKISKIIKV